MYHFEGVEPGAHVLQLDFEALSDRFELLSCEQNSRFAGSAYSMFIDLQGGTTWRADFLVKLKPKQTGDIILHLSSQLQDTVVSYELSLLVEKVPIRNSRIMIMLPSQMSYMAGSSHFAGAELDDPEISGDILTYRIKDIPGNSENNLDFKTYLGIGDEPGYPNTSCMLIYDTPEKPNQKTDKIINQIYLRPETKRVQLPQIILRPKFESFSASIDSSELRLLDKAVEILRNARVTEILVTGHSDNVPINPRSRYICGDNYDLSLARANSVANYLARSMGVDRARFTVDGKGPDEPIADNSTSEGRTLNRRVELTIFAEEILNNVIPEISKKTDSKYPDMNKPKEISINKFNQGWLNAAEPGFEWLWPPADINPPIPSLKIAVKHHADNMPRLFLDGNEVSKLNFSEMLVGDSGDKAVSFWSGIDIHQGFNNFAAIISDDDGNEIERLELAVHYAGQPVYVELIDSLSNLTADNRLQPTIAVRFTDKDGYPARSGVLGEWSVDPPYAAQQKLDELQSNPLLNLKNDRPNYIIGEGGIALLKLQASSRTGEAVLRFYFVDHEEEIRVWLKPKLRDWVVVGLAEGTIGYNQTKGNTGSMKSSGIENKFHEDGRSAFFASGSVQNSWLLTIAADTKKIGGDSRDDLMQTINPQKFYPLYGDAVQQGYAASSADGVFVKVEQDRYFALYGDYNTGLNFTELSRYNRTFTGFKSELRTEKNNFNIFLSETNLAFVKDEIRGDGTSGIYYLSRNNIAVNSEKITIEIRDRFRNEDIISAEVMRRYLDYNIDYFEGSVYFKRPIPSRDEHLNPIFIVAVYESNDNSDRSYNFGGRGGIITLGNKLEFGGTYIHEGRVGGHGDLGGFDATCKIGKSTELKTEFAISGLKIGAGRSNGYAYLTEVKHNTGRFSGKIYIRGLEPDFGLGQQNEAESGTRRIGADLVRRFNEKFQIGTQFYRQYNLLSDSKRNFGEARMNYSGKRFAGRAGLRLAEDHLGNGITNRSNQLSAGVGYRFFKNRFAVRLDREQSIGENDNADFPTRTIIGADYNLSQFITFYAQQEFARGEFADAEDTRVGVRARPWTGAQVNSSVQRHYNENGQRVFSNFGLIQSWRINENLSVDIGLDHGRLVQDPGNFRINPNEPPTSGSLDGFTALSLGGSYREESWSSSAKIEFRNAESEDKYGIIGNIFGEPRSGLGVLLGARLYNSKAISGLKRNNGDIQFSLVHRPAQTRWMVFNKLNFIFDKQSGGEFNSDNWRLVDNLSLNHRLGRKTRISFQYGAKYLRENIDGFRFSDYIDLIGIESRYDITTRWDFGVRLSLLHSWNLKQYDYSNGISTGYNLFKNAWLSAGYNFTGFEDGDFSAGGYSARGPYLQFRLKIDYESAKSVIDIFRSTDGEIQ
jgi:outer membrane protein OmpA-like peptidoglycan-associated protein